MKILYLTYRFGGTIPTGVTALRVADAMYELGHDLCVISSPLCDKWQTGRHIICNNKPIYPAVVFTKVGNLIQQDLNYIFWEWRMLHQIDRLLQSWKPDVIYARSSPSAVCYIAAKVAQKYNIPVLMHFTDPIPAPPEWHPNKRYRTRQIKLMEKILPIADKISFGNQAMLDYQHTLLKYDFTHKSFISPDPAPTKEFFYKEKQQHKELVLTFLGSFHGNRKPETLFKAIDIVNNSGVKCKLRIYDDKRGIQAPSFIEYVGRTKDVVGAMLDSDILVDVDADDKIPVFVSSKIKDYLNCGRPILSITPNNSPSRQLFSGMKTISLCSNNPIDISTVIIQLSKTNYYQKDYIERKCIIEQFKADVVAKEIINQMVTMLC